MKECDKCKFSNEDDAGFCGKCGNPMPGPEGASATETAGSATETTIKCEKCGAENAPEAKFCGSCGAAISAVTAADDSWQAEWKAEGSKELGAFPYVIAWLSFIPGIGVIFGVISIIWGILVTRKKGGPVLALIGIGGILFSFLLYGVLIHYVIVKRTGTFADLRSKLTVTTADEAVQAIELYKVKTGKYPETLNELAGSLPAGWERIIYDPSNTAIGNAPKMFYYQLINTKQYYLFSAGNDGVPFTKDDISPSIRPSGGMGYTIKE